MVSLSAAILKTMDLKTTGSDDSVVCIFMEEKHFCGQCNVIRNSLLKQIPAAK